jgi:Beta-propeller repeat/Bacterial Ig-like domain (group 2)
VVNGFQTSNHSSVYGNAFVARIDTTQTGPASLVYSTYVGGGGNSSNSSFAELGFGITADSSGRAYITGVTASDTSVAPFPTTAGAYQSSLSSPNGNAFLTVVDTTQSGAASLIYSSYLGGDGPGAFGDFGMSIAVDASGNAYLVGETTSDASGPFPTTSGAYQSSLKSASGNAFLTEIATTQSGSQSLVYSTYFGGSTTGALGDDGVGVTLDSTGKVYVAGDAESSDFPVTSSAFQTTNSANGKAFTAKFDLTQAGTQCLVYSTFLGGTNSSSGDDSNGIAVDGAGDSFIVGQTSSTDFPTTSDAVQSTLKSSGWNSFLAELSPDGSSLIYSTYLGGSGSSGDVATGVALDPLGNAYVAGYTDSADFPTTAGAFQASLQGVESAFVTKMFSPTAVVSIQVSPQNATLVSGNTQQFSATATLSNGNTQDVTASTSWSSSVASVLAVLTSPQTNGFAIGVSAGSANITAMLGTTTASTGVTVLAVPPAPVHRSAIPRLVGSCKRSKRGSVANRKNGYLFQGPELVSISQPRIIWETREAASCVSVSVKRRRSKPVARLRNRASIGRRNIRIIVRDVPFDIARGAEIQHDVIPCNGVRAADVGPILQLKHRRNREW